MREVRVMHFGVFFGRERTLTEDHHAAARLSQSRYWQHARQNEVSFGVVARVVYPEHMSSQLVKLWIKI